MAKALIRNQPQLASRLLTPVGLFLALIITVIVADPKFAQAANACARSYRSFAENPDSIWRSNNETEFLALRSNAPHYWAYMRKQSKKLESKELLVEGVVVGDAHIGNFGQVRLKNKSLDIRMIDFDDSGRGSLVLDLLRLWSSIKISPAELKSKDIWDAYLSGLRQEAVDTPKSVSRLNNLSEKEFDKLQDEYVDEVTKKDKFIYNKETSLQSEDLAPAWLKRSIKILADNLSTNVSKNVSKNRDEKYEILDRAWYIKSTAGSQGMARVWLLVKNKSNDQVRIIEFKQMADPATKYFEAQFEHSSRIDEAKEEYWPKQADESEFQVVSAGKAQFLRRTKYFFPYQEMIKKVLKKGGEKEFDLISEYVANLLGFWHGQQSVGKQLLRSIEANPEAAFEALKELEQQYRDELHRLYKKKG